jgi:hypothetical protein
VVEDRVHASELGDRFLRNTKTNLLRASWFTFVCKGTEETEDYLKILLEKNKFSRIMELVHESMKVESKGLQ